MNPSSGLNDKETEELMAFLAKLKAEGFTLLLIEHDMNVVMSISDTVTVMDMGSKNRRRCAVQDLQQP